MPRQIVRVEIKGQLPWRVSRSTNENWIAICDPLKITLEGETFEELTQHISEGLQLLLVDLIQSGEIQEFLSRQGWRTSIAPDQINLRRARFDVPYSTRIEESHATGPQVVCP